MSLLFPLAVFLSFFVSSSLGQPSLVVNGSFEGTGWQTANEIPPGTNVSSAIACGPEARTGNCYLSMNTEGNYGTDWAQQLVILPVTTGSLLLTFWVYFRRVAPIDGGAVAEPFTFVVSLNAVMQFTMDQTASNASFPNDIYAPVNISVPMTGIPLGVPVMLRFEADFQDCQVYTDFNSLAIDDVSLVATPAVTTGTTGSSTTPQNSSGSGAHKYGVLIGSIVIIVVGLAIIVVAVVLVVRWRKRKERLNHREKGPFVPLEETKT